MALIRGGPSGPDGSQPDGAYRQEVQSDRAALWERYSRQGVIRGFASVLVGGQLSHDFDPGSAVVEERDGSGNAGVTKRGYHLWSAVVTRVTHDSPDVAARNDAIVLAYADTEAGALGTGVTVVGPQIVIVRGVSGTSTPRTDTQVNAWIGGGGWVRVADVVISPGDTQVNPANVTELSPSALPPFASIRRTANQSIPNGSTTAITFQEATESRQPAGTASFADVANSRLVIPEAGVYDIEHCTPWTGNATGRRDTSLRINGAATRVNRAHAVSAEDEWQYARWRLRLAAGDLLDMTVFQNSGGALNVFGGTISRDCFLSAHWAAS